MSNMIGMDTAEGRALANQIRAQAGHITSVTSAIDGIVHQMASSWNGRDATEFIGWWQQKHRPALVAVTVAVSGLAQSVDNRASAQDQASASTGNPAPANGQYGGAGSSPSGSPAPTSANTVAVQNAEGLLTNPPSTYSEDRFQCLGLVNQAYGSTLPSYSEMVKVLGASHMVDSTDKVPYSQDLFNYYSAEGVDMHTSPISAPPPAGALVFYNYTSGGVNEGHVGISLGNGYLICTQAEGPAPVVEVPVVGTNAQDLTGETLYMQNNASGTGGPFTTPSYCTFEGWCMPPS